nr:phage major capsid protein [uncultured Allomuricauda sp.]
MNEELQKELEALTKNLEGKSKDEAQKEIKAFEEKFNKEIDEKVKNLVGEEVKTVREQLEKERAEKLNAMQEHLDQMDIKLQKKGGELATDPSVEIKEKKDSLKNLSKGVGSEVELKTLVTRSGAITNNAAGFFLPNIGQLGHKERSLYNVLPKIAIQNGNHAGTIRYRDWDDATKVRAAAMVAEGAAFPESTAAWAWYTKDLKKVGDTIPVTEEFFEDEQQAYGELDRFLSTNVDLVVDDQLVNGDNTGQNLEGLNTAAPTYTAVASGIAAPNLKDLAIKVRNSITRDRGSKYKPDILVVNSLVMEDLVLAKDANNNYIFDEATGTLGGLFVVVDENMANNQIIVGDRRFAVIYEKPGVVLSKGTVNNQFNEDEMTLKARKRLLLLVRTVDKTGFAKVTDVDTALATLAT